VHSSCKFARLDFVYVTPDPGFSRLDGADKRMGRLVKMLGGVLVLRRVATTDTPADEAHTQVDPRVASPNAVLTNMLVGFSYFDLIEVGTFFWHRFLLGLTTSLSRVPLWYGHGRHALFWTYDLGYVTSTYDHSKKRDHSLRILFEVLHSC